MTKVRITSADREPRVNMVERLRGCITPVPTSCERCKYAERASISECYYNHDVLMCRHSDTEGLIVHEYGHDKRKNGGVHPACPLCWNRPMSDCCEATKIKDSHAQIHEDGDDSFHYVICPYCHCVNKLADSTIGYRNCGHCEKIFNVK